MQGLLDSRIALVTGGGSGIGEGIAHGMAKAGARVLIADVNGAAAERVAGALGGDAAATRAMHWPRPSGGMPGPFRCW
jgi:3-oxoacyl-[acyl-carrier protein] reductase